MNDDGQDREVLDYVRTRMAADMPPEFTRDVMNDVQRTTQRRRTIAWPVLAGIGTVAAAVAVVVIGLGLINPRDPTGSEPTPSASASPAATPSGPPQAFPSMSGAPSPSLEPTVADGEFGPIHSMAPDAAFRSPQTCEVTAAISNAEPTSLSWRISFPEGWYTNEEDTVGRSACTLFGPEPFEYSDQQGVPDSVAIIVDIPPGGPMSTDDEITSTENYTVDGVAAVRYEFQPGGFIVEATALWIVGIAGSLPSVGNDQPYLAIQTYSDDPDELAQWVDILDRMVATLDIGE
jgi:hypothetical protein